MIEVLYHTRRGRPRLRWIVLLQDHKTKKIEKWMRYVVHTD